MLYKVLDRAHFKSDKFVNKGEIIKVDNRGTEYHLTHQEYGEIIVSARFFNKYTIKLIEPLNTINSFDCKNELLL